MLQLLNGKKTYLTGFVMVVFALTSLYLGKMNLDQAVQMLLTGFGFIFLRHGLEQNFK